uniref:FH2 domain-containing protein n=2 Tax=Amphimedon queenslandica TaxID=400682 RepID=A0A1X7UZJ0_AMPQE
MNGLEYLLDFLRSMNNDVRQSQLHYIILGSIKALMNNSDGRAHVLAHPTGITVIAQSLKTNNNKIKILTLEILGAVCLVPGGHKKVLNSMVHFQQFACERTRFQTVVMDLARSLDEDDSDSAALQVAVLSFLNALINYKAGEESLEFRLHLRYEFLMLGIQPIIARLRFLAIPQLIKHIEIFEFVRIEDEKEFTAQLNIMERVDYTNVINMASLLQKKTAYTPAYVNLVSLLYHCLLLPVGDPNYDKYWRLIDRMLLKYVPTKEEIETLRENLSEFDSFSRADKFMLEMSNVPRYDKRLKALSFTKTFNDRITEIRPAIEDITSSCHELLMSDKLRKLLEVILAFGNIMNRGLRGNAFGFKLSSLNRIIDTKSTTDNEMTLLHYLVQMLEAKFPDVLTLETDLPHINNACKVDLVELEKEFREIKRELANIKEELDYHKANPSDEESDNFVAAVEEFALHSAITVREMDHFFRDMKEQFFKALHYFGEDPKGKDQSPMKFFGVFSKFLKSLSEAHIHLITMRRKKEEEEKRKKDEEQRKVDTLKRRKARQQARLSLMASTSEGGGASDDLEGNLDELIARLQSGEPWNNYHGKKRNRRASSGSTLSKVWMQVSRERMDTPDGNGIQQDEVS